MLKKKNKILGPSQTVSSSDDLSVPPHAIFCPGQPTNLMATEAPQFYGVEAANLRFKLLRRKRTLKVEAGVK